MEVLKQEEVSKTPLAVREYTKGVNTELLQTLIDLEVGDGVKVLASEYHVKTGPSAFVSKYFKNKDIKFKTRRLLDGAGWLVVRIA